MIYYFVGIGGVIGAICRFLLGAWVGGHENYSFPFPTLVINLIGCFVLSFFYTLTTTRITVHPHFRTSFGTGFVGSFTTFSTFSQETNTLFIAGHYLTACVYIAASLLGGYLFTFLGISLGEYEKAEIRQESE
ncbi:fluoride efflux transporter CrcB [Aneurinibacillus terranovensis]|uniref:fluoride efflux transporter CrcB n=1 Tax=Aneurinibacillus terranovensis TaxID=278991 RepID=UPI0003FB69D9|nr:fluoride efflux transporter CrcB [Aneurinibacillus terranovensis]